MTLNDDTKEFFTSHEAAELMRVHINTIRNLIKRRELPGVKVGRQWRISKSDLQAYLSRKAVKEDSPLG